MKFEVLKVPDTVVVNRDFYDENEVPLIWQELLELCNPNVLTDDATTSAEIDGKSIKTGHGIFLDHIYRNRLNSNILTLNRKVFRPDVVQELISIDRSFTHIKNANKDFTLLNYYEENHEYGRHHDKSVFTALTLFWKEPKQFSGGDLILNGTEANLKPNDCIIFPGYVVHEVTPLHFASDYEKWKGNGRFSIAQFLNYR